MAVLLSGEDIHKTYVLAKHSIHVLKGACVEVGEGETVAIVGASGAGKSTLLHILGGLDMPESGTVHLKGAALYGPPRSRPAGGGFCGRILAWPVHSSIELVSRLRDASRRTVIRASRIGFVFQSYHLLPELSVLENTILPAMAQIGRRLSQAEMRRRGAELLEAVGLSGRRDHGPLELSGGEQQRLALARALMNDPEILLADEPTGNLDDHTGQQVLDYVFGLSRERGHAMVLVTHNDKVAARCDRTLRLVDGQLIARHHGVPDAG